MVAKVTEKSPKIVTIQPNAEECGRDRIRNAGSQEKAGLDSSWFPDFLIVRILAVAEFR